MPEPENPTELISHQLSLTDLFRLSLRIFKTKPIRTFLTIFGMSVGIGTVLFLISLGYGLQYILIGKLVTTEDSLITLEASYPQESSMFIQRSILEEISKIPEAGEISPIAEFPSEIKTDDSTGLILTRIIDPNYFRLSGVTPDVGDSFKNQEAGSVISNQAAKLINLQPNKDSLGKIISFNIVYEDGKTGFLEPVEITKPLSLKGIVVDDSSPPFAYIPSQFLSKEPPFFKSVLIKSKNIEVVEKLRDTLIEKGFLISARIDLVNQAKKVMNIITIILGVFGVAALMVSAIGMFNTMIVSFLERIYEVGIMKSLGATDRDIKNLFLMESFLMGFLGGTIGVLLGVGAGQTLNYILSIVAIKLGGKPLTLFITPMWFVVLVITFSSLVGVISGFWPAVRASYLSPKEAFKNK